MSQESSWLLWLSLKIYSKYLIICIVYHAGDRSHMDGGGREEDDCKTIII